MAKSSENSPAGKPAKSTTPSGIAEFAFQIIEPRCRGLLINALKNTQPVRTKWSLAVMNAHGGADVGGTMQRMPEIPGLTLIINPKHKTLTIIDPLKKDTDLLDRINAIHAEVSSIAPAGGRAFKHVPDQKYEFNDDEFKTIVMEFQYYNSSKCPFQLEMINGTSFPTDEQIEKLPGRELFDPRSNSRIQPKFMDQYDEWQEKLVFNT